jgi:3-oxoacyl-[acyl-carrier-protein] synthase III
MVYMCGSNLETTGGSASADIREMLERAGLQPEDVDFYVLHQANMRILEAVRTRLKVGEHWSVTINVEYDEDE